MTQYASTTSYMSDSQQGGDSRRPTNPQNINITQILVDFKNTIVSIGAPSTVEQKVKEYISLVEIESNKEVPRKETIITNLKTASKLLDEYISQTLKKPSNVVQDWMDAFLLQEVDYKADVQKAAIPASQQIEAQIEKTSPKPQSGFGENSAVNSYNNYQNKLNSKQKHTQNPQHTQLNQPQTKTPPVTPAVVPQATPQSQETSTQEPPRRRLKFAAPNGQVYEGNKVIGEKDEKGQTILYSEEEAIQKTIEAQTLPIIPINKAPQSQETHTPAPQPKINPISKNSMVQNFYEKAKEYLQKGDSQKALDSYKKTLKYAKKANDKIAETHIIQGIGESYNELNNLARAAKCFNKVTKSSKDKSLKATGHNCLGTIYDETGKFDLAMDHYFESLSLNGDTENASAQAKTLNNIGKMHSSRYMSKEAIDFYKLALDLAKQNKIPDIATMGSVLNNTGNAFKLMNKPQCALKYYQKSLICANKAEDKETASKAYEKAADLMVEMKKPQKAQSLYKKAMQEALNNKDSEQIRNIKEKMTLIAC